MDKEVFDIIEKEKVRQENAIELIASENFVSEDVLKAVGSCLTNKYTEGYPNARYYGACGFYDELELLCQERWLKVFKCEDEYGVNVQPHSGSQANFAAYRACGLEYEDKVLAMSLDNGGHLTHGSNANFSGNLYNIKFYNTDENGFIDMSHVEKMALEFRPKLILCGTSAYSRIIDFKRFKEIADKVGALMMVDMSHIAGLVVSADHPSPFGLADIITTTTHKTLRGPRGGLIFAKKELMKDVNSAVFPYTQGGSLMHVIAGKAVAAKECMEDSYIEYIHQVVKNTKTMCDEFIKMNYEVVTGGTDNHLFLIDFSKTHPKISGKDVQNLLEKHNITVNKNCVPNEKRKVTETSGIRIGLAAMTTKGWKEEDVINCAKSIDTFISNFYNYLTE